MTNVPGTFWPTARQELLLRIAFADAAAARAAWKEVRPLVPDELEEGTYAALPLVFGGLRRIGSADQLPWLKGIVRKTWLEGQLLVDRCALAAEVFAAARVDPILIGGAARALTWYSGLADRPTPHAEFLVEPAALLDAAEAFRRTGWAVVPDGPWRAVARLPSRGDGLPIVIRASMAPEIPAEDGDPVVTRRDRAGVVEVGSASVAVSGVADELLLALAGGARRGPRPTIQWVVDGLTLLDGAHHVDWERFVSRAARVRQTTRVRVALEYLSRSHGACVPRDVLASLAESGAGLRERTAFALGARLPRAGGRLAEAVVSRLEPGPPRLLSAPGSTCR